MNEATITRLVEALSGRTVDDDGTFVAEIDPMPDRGEIGVRFSDDTSCVIAVVHVDA